MSLIDKIAKGGPGGVYSEHVLPGTVGPVAPAKPFAEVGVTGLLRTRGVGYVYEEWLNNLSTYRQRFVYREMRDNDAVIGSMFFALEMILRKAEWRVEPAPGAKGDEYAAFLHSCMEDMCYDDATEVLAKRGWILFKDLREGDLLAQRTSKGVLEYVKPKALHVHDFDGELMGNAGDAVDFLVTPPHRMLFAKKHGRKHDKNQKYDLQIHRCEDVYGKSGWVSKGAGWAGKSTTRGMDWLEFLGFFVADGCASKRQVVLIQKETGYVENLLRRVDLFDKAKRRPVNGSYQWVISDVRLAESLREDFGVGSRNKRLPSWLKDATAVEIKRFLIGHAEGDGTECETGLVRHYTSSKTLADDIQEVAIKAGYATTLLERVGSENSFAPGVKNYGVSLWSQEEHLHPYLKAERNWYKQAYKGKVYCASVPSGVLMVRRNGKPMWCGNSHTWEDFIAESVSMFAFGFALFETVYKKRNGPDGRKASRFDDGLIGWRKMAPRAQESILYWVWDDDGGLQGAVQLAAPDYHTVPIPIEKLLLFRTTSLKNNPEGRSILRNVYRCFDEQTEILTRSGWKYGLDLLPDDEVAVLRDGKYLDYEVPSDMPRYEHKGEMLHFESRSLDQLVTPNHELWIRREHKAEHERLRADKSTVNQRHKRDVIWQQRDASKYVIPAHDIVAREQNGRMNVREHREPIEIPMDDWLAFLGVYVAEGCVNHTERQAVTTITQNEGPKADHIRGILARLPFHVCESSRERDGVTRVRWEICDIQLRLALRPLGKALDKYVPPYVREASARQIVIFLDAFHLGDGGMSGDAGGYDGTRMYFTASKRLADDLSELVFKAGGCPSVKLHERDDLQGEDDFRGSKDLWKVTHGRQPESRPRTITREDYDGLVWCVTTKSGVVYVRRNGKCQWSGNSWFFKRRIEEVEGIGIERDLCGIPTLYVGAEALAAMGGEQAAKQLVTNIRVDDQAGVILPLAYDDNKNPLVKLELLRTAGAKQTDTGATIGRYNSDILNTMLAGFVQFGQTPTGSRSLHMSATQIFSLAIGAFMDSVAAVMNRIAIPRLMRLNKMDLKFAPKLVAGEIGVRDLEELSTFCQQLSMAGLTFFDKPTANYIRKIARLPQLPDDDEDNKPPVPDASVPQDQNGPLPDPVKGNTNLDQPGAKQPGALPELPRTRATSTPSA